MPYANAEKKKVRDRQYQLENADKRKAYLKVWRKKNPHKDRQYSLKYRFGMTPEQYAAMKESQGGLCASCRQLPGVKGLVVDHDHATGQIRGLLCTRCNLLMGLVKDTPDWLDRAIKYLGDHRG